MDGEKKHVGGFLSVIMAYMIIWVPVVGLIALIVDIKYETPPTFIHGPTLIILFIPCAFFSYHFGKKLYKIRNEKSVKQAIVALWATKPVFSVVAYFLLSPHFYLSSFFATLLIPVGIALIFSLYLKNSKQVKALYPA